MLEKNDFLENTTKLLLSKKDKLNSFSDLKKYFSSNDYKGYTIYDHHDIYLKLSEMKSVIEKITSIVFNPHITAVSEEVIKRSELASSLSPVSFKETLRDTKLWKNKNGNLTPEYVHDEEYVDTFVTYENRFIAMLIDKFIEELSKIFINITPLNNSLEKQYEFRGISYGGNTILNEINNDESPKFKQFIFDDSTGNLFNDLAVKIKTKLKHLTNTEFYIENHKFPIVEDIKQTNILLHDPMYFYCYKYYLKNYKLATLEEENRDLYYYNYALLQILNYLQNDIKGTLKIGFNGNKLGFESFSFKKGNFTFNVKESNNTNCLEISSIYKDEMYESEAKYLLMFNYTYSKKTYKEIVSKIDNLKKQFDDITLVCQHNLFSQYSNILNISIYNKDNNLLIKNYFNSLGVLFKTNPMIYERICPICGEKHVIRKNDDYLCVSCSSHYKIFNKENETLIWIKSLRRKELWKEK